MKEPVIVRDFDGIRAGLDRAGDEPLMLARQLPGVAVLVCADRYRAGCVAEQDLGATVHILDDGFQHLQLDRDIDLVILGREDVAHPVTLPAGRLREPLDTIVAADAVLAADEDVIVHAEDAGIPVFGISRQGTVGAETDEPVLAVAGIASPRRFFDDLARGGWRVAGRMEFPDHHRYTPRDLARIVHRARHAGAARIVTTEKDYVRLEPLSPFPLPVTCLPLALQPEPIEAFRTWLLHELATTRGEAHG